MTEQEKNDKGFLKVQEILANHKPDPNQKWIQEVTPLRYYSKSFIINDDLHEGVFYKLTERFTNNEPCELYLFMNYRTLRSYQNYWKNLGSTCGLTWGTTKIGDRLFEVDKVNFGNVTLISLAPCIFNHPKYKSITPIDNEIFVVTKESAKPFVKEIKKMEKPFNKLLKEMGI